MQTDQRLRNRFSILRFQSGDGKMIDTEMGAGWVGGTGGKLTRELEAVICTLVMQLKPAQLTGSNQK